MDALYGIGALWVLAATVVTFGLARAAHEDVPFPVEDDTLLVR